MTPADDLVQRIDDTLEDWHGSPDAIRWSADAEPGLSGDGGDPDWVMDWLEWIRAAACAADAMAASVGAFTRWAQETHQVLSISELLFGEPEPTLSDESRQLLTGAPAGDAAGFVIQADCRDEPHMIVTKPFARRGGRRG